MLDIFANTFMNATRHRAQPQAGSRSHWPRSERFDNRKNAEMEAHLMGRRT